MEPRRALDRADLAADPLAQFARWFAEARSGGDPMPEAMSLATVDAAGAPSVRMVLLRGVDERGFRFYTSYEGRKGRELAANPRAALAWWWPALHRQVRAEGSVSRLPREESAAYFAGRDPESRLSAAASRQSRPIATRAAMEAEVERLRAEFGDRVPLPSSWGGYVLAPMALEFWQGRDARLHDRFRYEREGSAWRIERLQP